jgi:hypothetical protein
MNPSTASPKVYPFVYQTILLQWMGHHHGLNTIYQLLLSMPFRCSTSMEHTVRFRLESLGVKSRQRTRGSAMEQMIKDIAAC